MRMIQVGDTVRVTDRHGLPSFRGLTGIVERKVHWNKAYVLISEWHEIIVDMDDLETISRPR